ncbi:hypothetical protein C1645_745978 [Glomus cerebriforme]|uniref:Uncharacterized protein n=1 Tax=Glomus cerebriforme TaxID=658196 RepID=A0A397S9D5_9GLOM|nr:hypothetical protein C1645_745978 [Glomus cerebriforme]
MVLFFEKNGECMEQKDHLQINPDDSVTLYKYRIDGENKKRRDINNDRWNEVIAQNDALIIVDKNINVGRLQPFGCNIYNLSTYVFNYLIYGFTIVEIRVATKVVRRSCSAAKSFGAMNDACQIIGLWYDLVLEEYNEGISRTPGSDHFGWNPAPPGVRRIPSEMMTTNQINK